MTEARAFETLNKIPEFLLVVEGLIRRVGEECPRVAGLDEVDLFHFCLGIPAALKMNKIVVKDIMGGARDDYSRQVSCFALSVWWRAA